MTCCKGEIHVGDTPTYSVELVKEVNGECVGFDPAGADLVQLIFYMPNGVVIRKTANVTTDGTPPTRWFLEYQVQFGDGIGSPGEFHDNEGAFQVEGFVHFPTGQFHSTIETTDVDGQELRIFPNLD
jgi:hypothetical protein